MTMRMQLRRARLRPRLVPLAITAAVAMSVPAAGALADGARGGRAVHVEFGTSLPGSVIVGGTCDAAGACLAVVTSPPGAPAVPSTGDVQATGTLAGAAQVIGSDVYATALNTLVGHVDGCGTGTVTIRYNAHYLLGSPPDFGGGEWDIVPGTGSGDLAHAWGHGTFTVTSVNPDQSSTDIVTGLIHC